MFCFPKQTEFGNLNIGISSTLESTILPLFIDKLFVKFPDLNIKFIVNKSELLYNSLKNNELDFVIGLTPLNDNDLTIKPLYYEPILIVTTENIKKTNSTEIELSDIDTNRVLAPNKENEFRSLIENIFPSCNYNEKFENNSLETLVNLSLKGNGIALIPYLNYLNLREQEKTKVYKFKIPEPSREISIVCKRNTLKKHIIEEVFFLIKSSMKKIKSFTDVKIIKSKN